jgi:hypothetical protein
MNLPGCAEGNRRWRRADDMLTAPAFEWLRDLTRTANRAFLEIQTPPER